MDHSPATVIQIPTTDPITAIAIHANTPTMPQRPMAKPIAIEVRDGRPNDECLVFHCLVPAAHWWDDIVFT
jgi:hypothetical protein